MIEIKQAELTDIAVIEDIYIDAVNWLNSTDHPLWTKEQVSWPELSKLYNINDFYIVYKEKHPAGCIVLIDYDPFFWPEIKKGTSLFIHKLTVKRNFAKKGVSKALIDFAKKKATQLNINEVRLDCHQFRDKLRLFYKNEGFKCIDEKCIFGKYMTAFYIWKKY